MHHFKKNIGYINNQEEFLKKQIKEDSYYFDELKTEIENEKKMEAQYINDRILRMKSKIQYMKDDLSAKEKEFINIQKNKERSIYLERDDFIKQQQKDKQRILKIKKEMAIKKKENNHEALSKLNFLLKKEKQNLLSSTENNILLIKLRVKDLNKMIESHKSYISSMYQDIVDFQNKELVGIKADSIKHNKKFEDKFKLAEEMRDATINESKNLLKTQNIDF